MRKIILRIVAGVLIVVVLALVVVWLMIDSIAKAGIEYGGSYALGTETQVAEVDVKLLAGNVTLDGLSIENLEGYTDAKIVEAKHGALDVKSRSLFTSTVVVDSIAFDGLVLHIEEKENTNNVSEIIKNVTDKMKDEGEPSGRKLQIKVIRFTDLTAHVRLRGSAEPITLKVDEIEFKDITGGDAKGVVTAELMRRLFPALIAAVVKQGGRNLGALGNRLTEDAAGFAVGLGEGAVGMVKQVPGMDGALDKAAETLKKLTEKGLDAVNDLTDGTKKTIDDATKGIPDLIPKINP